jgi:DNA-binding PadR family transcriptional regulator
MADGQFDDTPLADSEPTDEEMPPTAWAVLGLLSFGRELSGYELKKWADSSLRFFYWSPAMSHIYRELRRLHAAGYVTSRAEMQDQTREKRWYTITASGRDALARWVEDAPAEPTVMKHGVALRLWLGHLAQPQKLRRLLEEHRAAIRAQIVDVDRALEPVDVDGSLRFPLIVLRFTRRNLEAELEATAALLDELEQSELDHTR